MSYQSKYTGQEVDSKLDEINTINSNISSINTNLNNKLNTSDLLNKVYPVGSIYLAYSHTSPASLFGGTWTRISQQFLWASSSDGTIGATGGAQTHTHTSAAHTHTINGHTHSTANHTLTVAQIPSHYHLTYIDANFCAVSTGNNNSWKQALVNAENHAVVNGYYDYPTGGGGAHNHGNTGSTSLTTNSTTPGDTGSSSNMPPYIQVSMWRRTA